MSNPRPYNTQELIAKFSKKYVKLKSYDNGKVIEVVGVLLTANTALVAISTNNPFTVKTLTPEELLENYMYKDSSIAGVN
jgi:hypothetical protein